MNRCILLHVDFASENFQNVSYKWTQFSSFWNEDKDMLEFRNPDSRF